MSDTFTVNKVDIVLVELDCADLTNTVIVLKTHHTDARKGVKINRVPPELAMLMLLNRVKYPIDIFTVNESEQPETFTASYKASSVTFNFNPNMAFVPATCPPAQ